MADPIRCFVAYPSRPTWHSETIDTAIRYINDRGSSAVVAQSWKELNLTGKIIIDEICNAIDGSQVFICDVTYINPNVLFELGYAIARNKRIWVTLDPSLPEAKANYEKLKLLTAVGYTPYQNANYLANRFLQEKPFEDLESTIFRRMIQSIVESQTTSPALLYLKSPIETDASIRVTTRLRASSIPLITDDPNEVTSHPLTWYAQNLYHACGLIAHLLDEVRDGNLLQNVKYSFVAGMAYGFKKPLLMLAHPPYTPPLDYRDLLQVHETLTSSTTTIDAWLPRVEQTYATQRRIYESQTHEIEHAAVLQRLNLGEDIAENEQKALLDYFIITAAFQEAFKTPQSMIYIGRKGSGKTANLYKIADKLQGDRRNHVCIIKPISYELEGIIDLIRLSTSKAEQGYLLQSLWKFLLYTELALSVYNEIESRPLYATRLPEEDEFVEYVESQVEFIKSDFTIRMERAIRELCQINPSATIALQRAKVSEILHNSILTSLRVHLGNVLSKRQKVCVLIDNLDKTWMRERDLGGLADFLFSLLSVSHDISEEFQRSGSTWRQVGLSLLIFLRSDIFSFIMREARERDKLVFRRLDWNDPLLLQRVIEERLLTSINKMMTSEEVWNQFFVAKVNGIPTRDYLVSRVIPRPRDIIYLCKAALAYAVNHKHSKIQEGDILQAERDYSQYALNSLEAETSAQLDRIEELIYEFVGADEIVTRTQLEAFVERTAIPSNQSDYAIDLLCDSTFLGREVNPGRFEFLYDQNRKGILQSLARRTMEATGIERFAINVPFHAYLEIHPSQVKG